MNTGKEPGKGMRVPTVTEDDKGQWEKNQNALCALQNCQKKPHPN